MLIFDQLKKNDPQLRLLALGVLAGLLVLLAGLWWVQVVSARDYREHLHTQAVRTVRIPAVRGQILDRTGMNVLAENQPTYNVSLYLEELKDEFQKEFRRVRPRQIVTNDLPFWKSWAGASAVKTQYTKLTAAQLDSLRWAARYAVASNVVQQVRQRVPQTVSLEFKSLVKHYTESLYVPYPIATRLDPTNIARFEEQFTGVPGVSLEVQSTRHYPHRTTAAHVLGYLRRNNDSIAGEDAFFSYRLPDYQGVVGIEGGYDTYLHGRAGEKSILVNSLGYRQTENIWTAAEPGRNVILTIDLEIQQAAERALRNARVDGVPRGAVVVMDVRNGDILAMASSPTFDPNVFVGRLTQEDVDRLNDKKLRPQINRAMQENYAPGSIFKTIIGVACLENGLDPLAEIDVERNPHRPNQSIIYVHGRAIRDTVEPGKYNFRRALIHSSNAYFITNGLRHAGIETIAKYARRLHLGEPVNLSTRQEAKGIFPSESRIRSGWSRNDTANICIGQGEMAVTPVQMAVMASALGNGGKVFWPRLVDRIESRDVLAGDPPIHFEKGRLRDHLRLKPSTMKVVDEAMLADVEDPEGTGRQAYIPGFKICSKTGTAQVMNTRNEVIDHTTWFLAYAPQEQPRYAVVVMIESGVSGGVTCAPIAREVYLAIIQVERNRAAKAVARAN